MSADVVTFVPNLHKPPEPESLDDCYLVTLESFLAMKERVDNPRRRRGHDVRRIGKILFDPIQYR